MKITVVGGGSFGTAIARALALKNYNTYIYDRKIETVDDINNNHRNSRYLEDVILPQNLIGTNNLATIEESDVVVLGVPSSAIGEMSLKIKPYLGKETILVSIAKGVDPKTLAPLSEVIEKNTGKLPVILSGPSHAEEVSKDIPTALVASSKDEIAMVKIQELFSTSTLRVYLNSDLKGVEIGGAVKNIIALAAGISDGLGYGDNTKAALMTRGMSEIIRIGKAMGAKEKTFSGLTGIGDLIVTCTSMHSRNRRCGIMIGQGMAMEEAVKKVGMAVEGISATLGFHSISEKLKVEMPITSAMYRILFMNEDPRNVSIDLMTRDLKRE